MAHTLVIEPSENATAIILAGGLGTRLRAVVANKPKVMAEVCGRPFLEFILDQVIACGIKQAVICVGYLADQIENHFATRYKSLELKYSREQALLGTGGAIRFALEHVGTEYALVLNGDSYCNFEFQPFANFHFSKQAKASVLLTEVADAQRYGRVILQADDKIQSFEEKGAHTREAWINAGIYFFAIEILKDIALGRQVSLEREVFQDWISKGVLYGYKCEEALFIDIGTPQSFAQAQVLLAKEVTT